MPPAPRRPLLTDEHRRLALLLRSMRKDMGLTQEQLAKRLHRDQGYVSKYETAERRVDLVQLDEICRAMGVDVVEVVQRFEKERSRRRSRA